GRRSGVLWWLVIITPLVLAVFFFGVYMGTEFVRSSGTGINIHSGGQHMPGGHSMPNIEPRPEEKPRRRHQHSHLRPERPRAHRPTGPDQGFPGHGAVVRPEGKGSFKSWEDIPSLPQSLQVPPQHDSQTNHALEGEMGEVLFARLSFRARSGAYVRLSSSLDEFDEVTAAAWIYIDPKGDKKDIQTVMGNKMSGCGADALGFALYVNEWEQSDGKLWLEWGDGSNGCHKLSSPDVIPRGTWVHVGARLDGAGTAMFVDGGEVASSLAWRKPGSREHFHLGAFPHGDFPFAGNISSATIFSTGLEGHYMEAVYEATATGHLSEALGSSPMADIREYIVAALELGDASHLEKDGRVARNAAGGEDGIYVFPTVNGGIDPDYRDGLSKGMVTAEQREESDRLGHERAISVKEAMKHVWSKYRQFAWGADELAPKSKRGKENWGSMGVTLVDSLDTLWLMDMKAEFWEARDWVRDHLTFNKAHEVSLFETTIRELGGLLSAYDLSQDQVFLNKARELGDRLLPAFDTATGLPTPRVNLKSNCGSGSQSVLAEIGTLQVEFRYLSHVTGDQRYANKVNKVFEHMSHATANHGLFPIYFNPTSGKATTNQVTLGALGDSFYEYLLKVWLQGGKTEATYRQMYDRAMDGVAEVLAKKSNPGGLTYISDWNGSHNKDKMDHLVCFLAGTLALGSVTADDHKRAERDMALGKQLAYTCYQMYRRQKTGLAPEMVNFENGKDMVVPPKAGYYILRPETAESLFILHQITKDPIFREWSWDIFKASIFMLEIEKHCRLPNGYGAFPNVNKVNDQAEDKMESFFLAETLKYLYLIQDPDQSIDLEKVVFNTEAHPLAIFEE
ncbi:unnamed protein product, partial [Discosporangium mesarthrocarpum]